MSNKVTWKKGMRLTPEVFNAMETAHDDAVRLVSRLASAGHYGLLPSAKPFELSIDIGNKMLEVVSLCCCGVTKSGHVINIDFDSNFTHTFDTRILIPASVAQEGGWLVVRIHESKWREINDLLSEEAYTFELVGKNSRLDDHCLPIGYIYDELGLGLRLDETGFVPPCLYITSHFKYFEQAEKASRYAEDLFFKCLSAPDCFAKILLTTVCTSAFGAFQRLDKERTLLTPAQLFSIVQHMVAMFLSGSVLDDSVNLEDQERFASYVQRPYDARTLYRDIEDGLSLWAEIKMKMETVFSMVAKPVVEEQPAPRMPVHETKKKGWEGYEV